MAARAQNDNLVENLLILGGLGYLGLRYVAPSLGVHLQLPAILSPAGAANANTPGPATGPRGIRNNNPGNLRWNILNAWQGQTGKDAQGYATFATPEAGIRAALKLLQNYVRLNGLDTIKKISARWAPAGDGANNPAVWASNVAMFSGIGQNTAINPASQAQMLQLIRGVIGQENGRSYAGYYSPAILARAWGML